MSAFGLMGAGMGLSALGGLMGAQSSGRDARQARDWYDKRTTEGANRYGYGVLGYDPWNSLAQSADYSGMSEADRAKAYKAFEDATGGSVLSQIRGLEGFNSAGTNAITGGFQNESERLRGLGAGNLDALRGIYGGGTDAILGTYDKGAAGIMGMADAYGRGREKTITRDAARAGKSADAKTRAALAASGLGNSTLLGNQIGANARNTEEAKQTALQNLGDAQTGLKTGLASGFLNKRNDTFTNLFGNWAGSAERTLGQNTANDYARSNARTVLDTESLNRALQLKQMTPNTLLSAMGSGVTNPWLGQSTSQYYPGYSGAGSALANLGSGAMALGGYGMMNGGFGGGSGGGMGQYGGGQMNQMYQNYQ